MSVVLCPFAWTVTLILRLVHGVLGSVLGPDAGLTWATATVGVLVVVRLLLLPFAVRNADAQVRLRELAPQLAAAAREHAGDPNAIAAARVMVYREAGVNPMAGWISLLVQVPAFMALALVLHRSVASGAPGYALTSRLVASLREANIHGAPLAASAHSSHAAVLALGGSPTAAHWASVFAALAAVMVTAASAAVSVGRLKGRVSGWFLAPMLITSSATMAVTAAALPLLLAIYVVTSTVWALLQGQWLRRRVRARATAAS